MKNQSTIQASKQVIETYIPQQVKLKIEYLCAVISEVEWSGILLYTTEGTIRDPENFKITLKDIIPMDKGSKTYTGFEVRREHPDGKVDDKMMDYFINNPEALDENVKMGLIHSHNSMSVYFSGVDISELEDNCGNHNFYLSVIVNNNGDICGKVATQLSATSSVHLVYKALDEDGVEYEVSKESIPFEKNSIMSYDCDFKLPEEDKKLFDSEFLESVSDIMKPTPVTNSRHTGFHNPTYGGIANYGRGVYDFETRNNKTHWTAAPTDKEEKTLFDSVEYSASYDEFIEFLFTDEEFTGLVSTVEEALEVLIEIKKDPSSSWLFSNYTKSCLKKFPVAVEEFFPESDNDLILSLIDDIILELDLEPRFRPVSRPISDGFKSLKKYLLN